MFASLSTWKAKLRLPLQVKFELVEGKVGPSEDGFAAGYSSPLSSQRFLTRCWAQQLLRRLVRSET